MVGCRSRASWVGGIGGGGGIDILLLIMQDIFMAYLMYSQEVDSVDSGGTWLNLLRSMCTGSLRLPIDKLVPSSDADMSREAPP